MTKGNWKLENLVDGTEILIETLVFKIGRHVLADVKTQSAVISRNHAIISTLADGLLYVTDNKSTNGTFVNDQRITSMEMRLLKHGDILSFGNVAATIRSPGFQGPIFLYRVVKVVDPTPSAPATSNFNADVKSRQESVYTVIGNDDDECIVISDEEDDDFSNSQIFYISKKIKEENASVDEVDPYRGIKEELKDLDYCNVVNYVPIDLTDETDHFESTAALLDILEITEANTNNKQNVLEILDNSEEEVKEPEVVSASTHSAAVNKTSEKVRKETSKRDLTVVLQRHVPPKHAKPPLVEPHYIMNIAGPSKPKKEPVKRKFPNKKEPGPIKKQRRSSSVDSRPLDNTYKQEIKEKRRQKLKEIAMAENEKYFIATQTIKTSAEVKVTNKRDDFILEDNKPSTSIKPTGDLRLTGPITRKATVTSRQQQPALSSNLSSSNSEIPERSGLIWNISSNLNYHRDYISSRKQYDQMEEIQQMIMWSVSWLLEQKHIELSPPINGNRPLHKVPSSFNDFKNYKSIMTSLIMLELWQYVFQTTFNKEEERTPVTVHLDHERLMGMLCCLDCEYSGPDTNGHAPFRQDDFCLIELRLKDTKNTYQYTGYGYIKSVTRRHLDKLTRFTILTKKQNKSIAATQLVVKVIANIGSNLRLLRTISCLEQSPLCQYVLEPNKLFSEMPLKDYTMRHTPRLNQLQKEICGQASEIALRNKPGFYVVQGPPGTGKSSVIVCTILEILYKAKQQNLTPYILVTAPSNAAVDCLILKLNQARCELAESDKKLIKIVRIGPDSSISELVNRFTLRYQSRKTMIIDNNLRKEYSQVEHKQDMDTFLKEHLGHKFSYGMKVTEDRILLGANIICTTLTSCVSYILNHPGKRGQIKYTCCIVDEATQCNEIESLLPIQLKIDKFILVGDPQQLPAVVCNKDAQRLGFGKSLFTRMFESFASNRRRNGNFPLKVLCHQYRMHPEICDYPNRTYYEGKLKSFPVCHNPIIPRLKPYLLFNLMNDENSNRSDYVNSDEVSFICNLLELLRTTINNKCQYSIGIITPYRLQKDNLVKRISEIKMNPNVIVTVNTVDSFQGMENDIIIISCVRYSSNYFLSNEQRLNVALTRARQALYIIGNYSLFKQCRPLYDLREDAKKRKRLLDINPNRRPQLRTHIFR